MALRLEKKLHDALVVLDMLEFLQQQLQSLRGLQDIKGLVTVVRSEAKARGKLLALEHHPDKGGSLEKMQELNAAVTEVRQIKLLTQPPPPPPPPRPTVHVVFRQTFHQDSSTLTSYTTTNGFSGPGGWYG